MAKPLGDFSVKRRSKANKSFVLSINIRRAELCGIEDFTLKVM